MPNRARRPDELVPHEISDHSLLRRLRSGSEDAATALYVRYARRLYDLTRANSLKDLATRIDADDIVQSVFRTFFRRVAKGEYDVPDGDELWKLLLVIGLNKLRAVSTYHRAAKRDVRATVGGDALKLASEQAASGDEASLTILRLVIDEVLSGLSAVHREIIDLRIEGHEVAEISTKLGRSKRSVERILQGFRQMLATMIDEDQ
ncbi:MAG: sigma-70 family polymerase sigma factor [Planctomycetaceae bacterium]|nr:sigma-70 family polymerase sigma factor [Planctomycetaceae bacterium]